MPRQSKQPPNQAGAASTVARTTDASAGWKLDLGANVVEGGVHFRVWAPNAERVEVVVDGPNGTETSARHVLTADANGYFVGVVGDITAGARYRYSLDGGQPFPDPCSRSQPDGPHEASEVVDPSGFDWHDAGWPGLLPDGLAIYELHVGTFTPEGTFDAAIARLADLRDLGISAIELMPLAEFPGRRNWGYDGVDLFAPFSGYGGPEGLRRFVDAAHTLGLGVLLDVVYNHFGPDGNYLRIYSNDYFTDRHVTPWGDAVNYDGPNSQHVRHFVLQNVRYWLEEYHLDGLRLDAVHEIIDTSPRHLLAEIAAVGHSVPGRSVVIIAEDHRNLVHQIRPAANGGFGLDGVWADDFHHALRTYLTGEREGYYANYPGALADVAATIEQGFLFQGQMRPATGEIRGTQVTDEPAREFVFCSENHDQVGNRALGERLNHLIDRERYLVASAVLLLAPETILLFQGQEFATSRPFQFFTDHNAELGALVTEGRRKEFAGFAAFADPVRREKIPDPQADTTFQQSVLDWGERERNAEVYNLYRTLLALRRSDPVLSQQQRLQTRARAVGEHLLALRRWHDTDERLLLANFGQEPAALSDDANAALGMSRIPAWRVVWGTGTMQARIGQEWGGVVPGRAAVLLAR
jgi:maltooligosyltrehalose trehalohydrolase